MKNFLLGLAVGAVIFAGASWATDNITLVPLPLNIPQDEFELTVPAVQLVRAQCYARNPKTGLLDQIELSPR